MIFQKKENNMKNKLKIKKKNLKILFNKVMQFYQEKAKNSGKNVIKLSKIS